MAATTPEAPAPQSGKKHPLAATPTSPNTKQKKQRSNSTPLPKVESTNLKEIASSAKHSAAPPSPTTKKKIQRSNSTPGNIPASSSSQSTPSSPVQKFSTISTTNEPIPIRSKLHGRFYETLALLSVLGRNRGAQLPEDQEDEDLAEEVEESSLSEPQLRRAFTRSLAYICDYEKGGPRTTAIALEETASVNTVWIASNNCPNERADDSARVFLEIILRTLVCLRVEDRKRAEDTISKACVMFSRRRITTYTNLLGVPLKKALGDLEDQNIEADKSLIAYLQELQGTMNSPQAISEFCYNTRDSESYLSLRARSQPGQRCAQHFEKIRHLIGRLNHTKKAVKIIVSAALTFPSLFDNICVKRIPSSHASKPPLLAKNPSMKEIFNRMLPDSSPSTENAQKWSNLQYLDQTFQLSKALEARYRDPTWRPKVHAELLILNHFYTKKLNFVDGDKYIGCSKPACYCCYNYIRAHKGGFVVPGCHNNNWVNWKPPEIFEGEDIERLLKEREDVLNEMRKRFLEDIWDQIERRRGPVKGGPDSLTEISTVRFRGVGGSGLGSGDMATVEEEAVDEFRIHQVEYKTSAVRSSMQSLRFPLSSMM